MSIKYLTLKYRLRTHQQHVSCLLTFILLMQHLTLKVKLNVIALNIMAHSRHALVFFSFSRSLTHWPVDERERLREYRDYSRFMVEWMRRFESKWKLINEHLLIEMKIRRHPLETLNPCWLLFWILTIWSSVIYLFHHKYFWYCGPIAESM